MLRGAVGTVMDANVHHHHVLGRVRSWRAVRSSQMGDQPIRLSRRLTASSPLIKIAHVSNSFSSNRTCGVTAYGSRTEFTPGPRSHHTRAPWSRWSPYS